MNELRLSELGGKEIVDVKKAERLGVLGQTDLEINEQTGQIVALIIPTGKWFQFRKAQGEIRVLEIYKKNRDRYDYH